MSTARKTIEWLDKKLTENNIPHKYNDDLYGIKSIKQKSIVRFGEEDGSTFQIVILGNLVTDCIMVKGVSYGYEDGYVEYYNGIDKPRALTKKQCLKQFIKDYERTK